MSDTARIILLMFSILSGIALGINIAELILRGGKISKMTSSYSMTTNVKFLAISNSEGNLCTIYKESGDE